MYEKLLSITNYLFGSGFARLGVLKLNNGEKYENNELQTTRRGMR